MIFVYLFFITDSQKERKKRNRKYFRKILICHVSTKPVTSCDIFGGSLLNRVIIMKALSITPPPKKSVK